jgi:Tfp pilus assembly protein PilX
MGTMVDHRKCAEECVAMARLADDQRDKALWLTLAQSWVRLGEHVARIETEVALAPQDNQAQDNQAQDGQSQDKPPQDKLSQDSKAS